MGSVAKTKNTVSSLKIIVSSVVFGFLIAFIVDIMFKGGYQAFFGI